MRKKSVQAQVGILNLYDTISYFSGLFLLLLRWWQDHRLDFVGVQYLDSDRIRLEVDFGIPLDV